MRFRVGVLARYVGRGFLWWISTLHIQIRRSRPEANMSVSYHPQCPTDLLGAWVLYARGWGAPAVPAAASDLIPCTSWRAVRCDLRAADLLQTLRAAPAAAI